MSSSLSPLPTDILKALANVTRWEIVTYLAWGDHRVQEIIQHVQESQNVVSFHLKQLREIGVLSEHRSTADARDIYYHLELETLRHLYLMTGMLIHPSILANYSSFTSQFTKPLRILFLCSKNSARSQMAEGWLRYLSHEQIEVFSAGTTPTTLHPMAIEVMEELGVNIRPHWAKPIDHIRDLTFDEIITVCDRAREYDQGFPVASRLRHWSLPDPVECTDSLRRQAFVETALELRTRTKLLLHQLYAIDHA